jgi:hypothetical protein
LQGALDFWRADRRLLPREEHGPKAASGV